MTTNTLPIQELTIAMKDINKTYRSQAALTNVNGSFETGCIHGLLGRNGAGKTTLLNLIASYDHPSSGHILYNHTPYSDQQSFVNQVSYIRESEPSWEEYKLKVLLDYCQMLIPSWDQARAESYMKKYQLNSNKRYKQLSRGMKSMFGIVKGFASRTPLTIFDEPVLGLDAAMRQQFYDDLLAEYEQEARTFIVSTHLIDESENVFERVSILHQGQLLLQQSTQDLLDCAYTVSGTRSDVESIIHDQIVLHADYIGSLASVAVWKPSAVWLQACKLKGLELTRVPLQKLFIYLTDQPQLLARKEDI